MEFGVVKWFDEAKGYVCISREHGEDALVSISAIQAGDFKKLKSGETVKFNSEAGGHFGQQIKGWNPKMMLRSIGKKLGVRATLNFLLNPLHKDAARILVISASKHALDRRLLQ